MGDSNPSSLVPNNTFLTTIPQSSQKHLVKDFTYFSFLSFFKTYFSIRVFVFFFLSCKSALDTNIYTQSIYISVSPCIQLKCLFSLYLSLVFYCSLYFVTRNFLRKMFMQIIMFLIRKIHIIQNIENNCAISLLLSCLRGKPAQGKGHPFRCSTYI